MRWLKPTLNSLYGLLGQAPPMPELAVELRTQGVRQAMLDVMAEEGFGERHPRVVRRIFYADDVEVLWYVRSDMMMALAGERGETFAQGKVDHVSGLFEGLLPAGLIPRKSRRPH